MKTRCEAFFFSPQQFRGDFIFSFCEKNHVRPSRQKLLLRNILRNELHETHWYRTFFLFFTIRFCLLIRDFLSHRDGTGNDRKESKIKSFSEKMKNLKETKKIKRETNFFVVAVWVSSSWELENKIVSTFFRKKSIK